MVPALVSPLFFNALLAGFVFDVLLSLIKHVILRAPAAMDQVRVIARPA